MNAKTKPKPQLINLDEVDRELARRKLIDFTTFTKADYIAGWFHRDLCARLDRFYDNVLNKRSPRLMIFAPPRHGKTELVSRRFPAWAFGKNPDLSIISTSYGDSLAKANNRDVQRIIRSDEYHTLFPDVRIPGRAVKSEGEVGNMNEFQIVGSDGYYLSAGVNVGITGRGANIFNIDDPVKDGREANSPTIRASTWEWYLSTARTRLQPGGGILLVMTRWNPDDLAGKLLLQMESGEGDAWEVVSYPAIAEEDEPHRRQGDPLCPELFDLETLQKTKRSSGSRIWESMYQQRPTNREGGLFKRHWFTVREGKLPVGYRWIRYWDMAATTEQETGDPDYTTGALVGVNNDGLVCVADMKRERLSPLGVEKLILNTASQDGRSVKIGLEQEPGSSGKIVVNYLIRQLGGYNVKATLPSSSKEMRAGPIAAQAEAGNVWILRGAWNADFLDEAEAFPLGNHDDQIDPVAAAYIELMEDKTFWRVQF